MKNPCAVHVGMGCSSKIWSGTHRSWLSHVSLPRNCSCSSGTDAAGTQCARASQHAASFTGALVGPGSHDSLHAPVSAPVIGSKHGAQRSLAAHESCGNSASRSLMSGSARDKHRPSAPATDTHVFAMNLPPVSRKKSGTHSEVPSAHFASCACCAGSVISAAGAQCASSPHAASVAVSTTGGHPDSYVHVFGSSQAVTVPPPPS